ncbi:MAG: hypothetical protein AMXMBFR78_11500 [Rubrivivax sp.]|jgi:hypothetical protein
MGNEAALIVQVRVQKLDGLFYAASADVPGLHVCGESIEQTIESTLKAVKELFRVNREIDVHVVPASDDVESFPRVTRPIEHLVVQRVS